MALVVCHYNLIATVAFSLWAQDYAKDALDVIEQDSGLRARVQTLGDAYLPRIRCFSSSGSDRKP